MPNFSSLSGLEVAEKVLWGVGWGVGWGGLHSHFHVKPNLCVVLGLGVWQNAHLIIIMYFKAGGRSINDRKITLLNLGPNNRKWPICTYFHLFKTSVCSFMLLNILDSY